MDKLQQIAYYCVVFLRGFSILNNSIAKEVMTGPSHDLLESVAEEISLKIMIEYGRITAVRVKVAKPDLLLGGPIDYLGIEIFRSRDKDLPI